MNTKLLKIYCNKILLGSYLYYWYDESLYTDHYFDHMMKQLHDHYDDIKQYLHPKITKDDLAAGSLYHIHESDYAGIIKQIAWDVLKNKPRYTQIDAKYEDYPNIYSL